jgi:hypothetical protein
LLTALQLGVALEALLLHQGFVVIGASGDVAPPAAAVSAVAEGLRANGAGSVSGRDLRQKLLGDAQPVGELSEAQAALYARALAAYDEGAYAAAAGDAEAAFKVLDAASPSTRQEALIRQAQLVWGASLVQSNQVAVARAHFRWALERDPFLIADHDRFPPPVQHAFERERTAVAAETPSRLAVTAAGGMPAGVTVQLLVDGLPRGALPRDLSLPAHDVTFWVEAGQPGGWAHHAVLTPDHSLSVDLDLMLESALTAGDRELLLVLPVALSQRQAVLGALMARSGMSDLVVVAKARPPGASQRLTATRFDANGVVLTRTAFDPEQAASATVAQALLGLPAPKEATREAVPAAGVVEKKKEGSSVLPIVLGVVGVVAVAAVLTAVLWPRSFELTLTPSVPR